MVAASFAGLQVMLLLVLLATLPLAGTSLAFPSPASHRIPLRHGDGWRESQQLSALHAVTFRYSSSSLDHLKALDDEAPSDDQEPINNEATAARNQAIAGALASMAIVVGGSLQVLPTDCENLSFFLGAVTAAGGYVALGGPQATQASKPQDGGYDATFVVDKPGRLRAILEAIARHNRSSSNNNNSSLVRVIESPRNAPSDTNHPESDRISNALRWIRRVHTPEYIDEIREACEEARVTGITRRLHPTVMRTLVDEHSFDAATASVADWIDALDDAMVEISREEKEQQQQRLNVCLSRPPSHHACQSRGSGGCLLNGPAIAAHKALAMGATSVAVLDIDAHHGNGIAHCVQDAAGIRYCSIHEEVREKNWFRTAKDIEKKERSNNPRGPDRDDTGPLGNICNLPLPKGTTWDTGYKRALVEEALPFLTQPNPPDLLIVAAGFDALAVDASSGLALQPRDYRSVGELLRATFGTNIVVGLEGGYVWQDGTLGHALLELVQPWMTAEADAEASL